MQLARKFDTVTVGELRRFLENFEPETKVRFVAPDNEELSVNEMYRCNGEPNIDLTERRD